jgi:transmembrane sensor
MTDHLRSPESFAPRDDTEWEALARYLAGETPAGEQEQVRRSLEASPRDAAVVAALERAMGHLHAAPDDGIDVEGALALVNSRRMPVAGPGPSTPRLERGIAPSRRSVRWRVALPGLAAAAILAVSVALFRAATRGPATGGTAGAQTYATTVGQRDSVRLPDGTRVLLGPQSRVVVAEGYGNMHRDVELRGEALFDVVHDDARPFVVRAGAAVVRDIGTSFTVRTDMPDSVIVAVTAGSVLMRAATSLDGGVVLHAGDLGVLGTDGQVTPHRGGAGESDVAWMRGVLVFKEAPLSVVATELRRWYGLELRVGDSSLAGRHLQATFDGEPVEEVLRVIGTALGAEIERRGDTVWVQALRGTRSR